MTILSIPPHLPFLDTLARWWLDRTGGDPSGMADGLFLLPTRRAARGLQDAFLRETAGRPVLLPRIAALGALDEAPLALAGALDLPPAVGDARRLAVLTRMVMKLEGEYGAPATVDRAWQLAAELAGLLDEAHRAEVPLHDRLPGAAEAGYAEHWGRTITFLQIVTAAWPQWLADNGLMDRAERSIRLLDAQRDAWLAQPPGVPVIVAGTTGGIAAVARLIRVVAALPGSAVVLPGVDFGMADAVWGALDPGHPQAGLRRLLRTMEATRGDVTPWPVAASLVEPGRGDMLAQALLPARALAEWRRPASPVTEGLWRLEAADQQEEAVAIALALRGALEVPHARAALVTPDRQLAGRVAAELARYGVVVDDSAGEPLADTPPAALLRLLARAVADGLSPVSLLSVLKHPLTALGLRPAVARAAARQLELACLRGPAPAPGIAGLRAALARRLSAKAALPPRSAKAAEDLLDRLAARLEPILRIAMRPDVTPADALAALIACAEAVTETDALPGAARLWALEEGEALATHLSALGAALPILPAQPVATLPGLLDASMEGAVVRSRRALRGRTGTEHPRVAILGLLEARLQSADLMVLASLTEGVWPPATDPGPWMSRPMRTAVGLPSPEERVGQMAHDFLAMACAAPTVVLSCPRRRDGAPAVPARWLVRLDAYLDGHGTRLPLHPAAGWARLLDQPDGPPCPVAPPEPRPALADRPRRLSVTEIETWLADPYAIFAKHVLGLRALDALEESADHADYGSIVHKALSVFLMALPATYPPDAPARLRAAMDGALEAAALRPALAAWWRPRLHRIADWAAEAERQRRLHAPTALVRSEVEGRWAVPANSPFELRGRADRIERRPDGTLAILDYKTGAVPSGKDVVDGRAPQLPLEAAMAAAGVFGAELAGQVTELTYWHLSGGFVPGRETTLKAQEPDGVAATAQAAQEALVALIHAFDDPARPYLSRPHAGAGPRFSDYAQLARVSEWAAVEEGE